jgi:hypothetical protein
MIPAGRRSDAHAMHDGSGWPHPPMNPLVSMIRGDPVARPAEIRNVVTVFKDGVGYDSKKILETVEGLVGIQ